MQDTSLMHADETSLPIGIRDGDLVMVDFWASWCAPCRAMAPLLDRLTKEFPDLQIIKVDAEAHKQLLEIYGVRSLPTLQIYRKGEKVEQLMGKVPYEIMRRAVQGAV